MRPLIAVVCVLSPIQLPASEPAHVDVRLVDGRHVFGIVDQRTDSKTLWIRSTDEGIVLCSGHSWNAVSHVQHGNSVYSGVSMVNSTLSLRSSVQALPVDAPCVTAEALPVSSDQGIDSRLAIRSVRVDAVHSNWDRDAETDGLRVVISPVDGNSDIIAVDGIAEVELIAEHFSPTQARRRFERLGRWTRTVKARHFEADGISVNLPYQRFRPDRDLDVLSSGLVQVRFKVPGVGSFEAADPWVRLRPSSPSLNRYQLHTGQRSRIFGRQINPTRMRPVQRY